MRCPNQCDPAADALSPMSPTHCHLDCVAGTIDADHPRRLQALQRDASRIIGDARSRYFKAHRLTATVAMFSGGNDSTVLAHVMRSHVSHFGHANTTIGVEATREFVRTVSADWGIPLVERQPDPGDRFEDIVREYGFPGPSQHVVAYRRLKERAFRKIRSEFVSRPRSERVLFLSGVRLDESSRRGRTVNESSRDGSTVWAAPLANWTDADMALYRAAHPDVPRNEVTDHLHLSGECLCGAFAGRGEEDLIRFFYPDVGVEFDRLSDIARAAGKPEERCRWGWGAYRDKKITRQEWEQISLDLDGTLCSACAPRMEVETETPVTIGSAAA